MQLTGQCQAGIKAARDAAVVIEALHLDRSASDHPPCDLAQQWIKSAWAGVVDDDGGDGLVGEVIEQGQQGFGPRAIGSDHCNHRAHHLAESRVTVG